MARVMTTILMGDGTLVVDTIPDHMAHPRSKKTKQAGICKGCDEMMFRAPMRGPHGAMVWAHPTFYVSHNNQIVANGWTQSCRRFR